MRVAMRVVVFGLGLVVAVGLTGCGGDGRYEVTGTVTFQGKDLPAGAVEFDPGPGGVSSGAAQIVNGRYTLSGKPGLATGTYKVRIKTVGAAPQAKDVPPGSGDSKAPPEPIPEKYNTKTTLTAEVGPGKTTHDFKLD